MRQDNCMGYQHKYIFIRYKAKWLCGGKFDKDLFVKSLLRDSCNDKVQDTISTIY